MIWTHRVAPMCPSTRLTSPAYSPSTPAATTKTDSHLFIDFPTGEGQLVRRARMVGIVMPGQPPHVVQRGHKRQDVFFVDDGRRAYHHRGYPKMVRVADPT